MHIRNYNNLNNYFRLKYQQFYIISLSYCNYGLLAVFIGIMALGLIGILVCYYFHYDFIKRTRRLIKIKTNIDLSKIEKNSKPRQISILKFFTSQNSWQSLEFNNDIKKSTEISNGRSYRGRNLIVSKLYLPTLDLWQTKHNDVQMKYIKYLK